MPHHPKTEYYRINTKKLQKHSGLFEFLISMFPRGRLNEKRIKEYSDKLATDDRPTAIALSVLDVKEPAVWDDEKEITSHWCLAHYLIDGHHKIYAGARENKPITLISFLTTEQGVSSKEDIENLLQKI